MILGNPYATNPVPMSFVTGQGYTTPQASGAVGGGSKGQPASTDSTSFLESILPGFSKLSSSATDIVGNLLNGTPSPSTTRNAAATFGAANGQGNGSGIASRWGYDLYNQKGEQNQQTGIQNLLQLIGGISSPVLQNKAQNNQNSQFYSNLGQEGSQFNQNFGLQQFLAQLQALGLGNSITDSGNQPIPQFNF